MTAGADGWIRHVYGGESGSFVAKGQPLASYYSRDIASPQQGYLYALDSYQRVVGSTSSDGRQKVLATKATRAGPRLPGIPGPDRTTRSPVWSNRARKTARCSRRAGFGRGSRTAHLRRGALREGRRAVGDRRHRIRLDYRGSLSGGLGRHGARARRRPSFFPGGVSARPPSIPASAFDADQRVAKLRLTVKNPDRHLFPE